MWLIRKSHWLLNDLKTFKPLHIAQAPFETQGDEHLIRQQLQKDMEIWNGLARQKLAASKDARKKAEADVQLLANRLRLLRAEEAKALKIIEDVRKRTREVLETRMKNQQMLLDQSNFKQNSQEVAGWEWSMARALSQVAMFIHV